MDRLGYKSGLCMDIVWITIGYDRIETCLRRASLRFVLRFNAASAFVSFTHIRVRLRRPGSLLPAPYVPVMSAHCGCNRFHRGPLIPAPVIFAACGVLGTTSKIAAKRFVTHAADISCDCHPGGHRPTQADSGPDSVLRVYHASKTCQKGLLDSRRRQLAPGWPRVGFYKDIGRVYRVRDVKDR